MSSKIKAVDIVPVEVKEEPLQGSDGLCRPKVEDVVEEQPVEEAVVEQVKEEEHEEVEASSIQEIIEEEAEKPKVSRKMITCPDCNKTM